MLTRAFKIYLFLIFLIFGLFSGFYIEFVSALNYAGDFDYTAPSEVAFGSSDFDFTGADPFSLELWYYIPAGTTGEVEFLSKMGGAPEYKGFELNIIEAGITNYISFTLRNKFTASDNVLKVQTDWNPISFGVWSHLVVTYDGSKNVSGVKIYENNSSNPLMTLKNSLTNSIANTGVFKIGMNWADDEHWNGFLDEVRIWDKELTALEVGHLWNSGDGVYTPPVEVETAKLLSTYRFDENGGTDILDSTGSIDGVSEFLDYTAGKVIGDPPSPVEWSFSAPEFVLQTDTYFVGYNVTSTSSFIQSCGLWSPVDLTWFYSDDCSFDESESCGNFCSYEVEIPGAYWGLNEFFGSVIIGFQTYFSDAIVVTGIRVEDDPISPSDIPTINFNTANTTSTVGVLNTFFINSADDIRVLRIQIFDSQLGSYVAFENPVDSNTFEVEFDWTPESAGLFRFYVLVYDNHSQIGVPVTDPQYLEILVEEAVPGGITFPSAVEIIQPDRHFLIEAAEVLIGFLQLPEIWDWFISLFQSKFPFSWFFSIFEIWGEQRATILGRSAVESLKVEWTFPGDSALGGTVFTLFDLQGARDNYSNFFDIMRVILINIFWLGFAGVVFSKVKKFVGEMSAND